ncbi:hypothetical protein [Streptomyces sp. enrichment culture]|uniref:hypothetical protein n=1 Tax=Streptomyces sp. enrichment culture TaxID=1795815 RepID=UPI003F576524
MQICAARHIGRFLATIRWRAVWKIVAYIAGQLGIEDALCLSGFGSNSSVCKPCWLLILPHSTFLSPWPSGSPTSSPPVGVTAAASSHRTQRAPNRPGTCLPASSPHLGAATLKGLSD